MAGPCEGCGGLANNGEDPVFCDTCNPEAAADEETEAPVAAEEDGEVSDAAPSVPDEGPEDEAGEGPAA